MKKKLLVFTFLVFTLLTMTVVMIGCGVNGEKEVYECTIELGEEYTFNAMEIFGVDVNEAKHYEADISTLDVNKAGTYDVNVKFQDKALIVRYNVVDTKCPMITLKENYVFTNDITNIDFSSFAEYTDAGECTEEVTRFEKVDALKVLKDADIKSYTDRITFTSTEDLLDRENTSITEDGIYKAVYSVTDAAGNVNAREVIVILDTKTPEVSGIDDLDTIIEVENVNDEWTKTFAETLQFTDNVDGNVANSKVQVMMTLTNKDTHTYTVRVTFADRAGNLLEKEYSFSLVAKNGSTTESQEPNNGGNGDVNVEPTEPEYTYKELNQTMYVTSNVNVRDLPTSDGKKLGSLSENAEVKVTGQCNETKWYRIEFDGKVAYVSNKYLTTEKPKEEEPSTDIDDNDRLPSGYSWQDRDGDGFADLPDSVNINGWNVRTKDVAPEFALFIKELSEAGMYEVKTYTPSDNNKTYYYVLAPTIDEAFEYLENWLLERGMKWGHGSDGWWDTDRKVAYCSLYDVYEIK